MNQPPKDKKEIQEQKIIGETAPDKSITEKETEEAKDQSKREEKIEDDKEELTNTDQKITNTDEKNDSERIAF